MADGLECFGTEVILWRGLVCDHVSGWRDANACGCVFVEAWLITNQTSPSLMQGHDLLHVDLFYLLVIYNH